ncbi:hypothetical protein LTR53_011886 [Teratosphaeriaceae sp. CCFEE 6253]|nr:hypothetical protein LTR53_011886 [Teratosphaeriaceae sp. CCFEE 6253]
MASNTDVPNSRGHTQAELDAAAQLLALGQSNSSSAPGQPSSASAPGQQSSASAPGQPTLSSAPGQPSSSFAPGWPTTTPSHRNQDDQRAAARLLALSNTLLPRLGIYSDAIQVQVYWNQLDGDMVNRLFVEHGAEGIVGLSQSPILTAQAVRDRVAPADRVRVFAERRTVAIRRGVLENEVVQSVETAQGAVRSPSHEVDETSDSQASSSVVEQPESPPPVRATKTSDRGSRRIRGG